MKLCFATNNHHKIEEVMAVLGNQFQCLSLSDIGCNEELPETSDTLEGNATQKALYVWEHYRVPCFSDDTGLEVNILNGSPGVFSARYAGPQRNSDNNIDLLLKNLEGSSDRSAQFRTVISLILPEEKKLFEGIVRGTIIAHKRGNLGFGYDPVFVPDGFSKTLAELSMDEKNRISHRGLAVRKLAHFLSGM